MEKVPLITWDLHAAGEPLRIIASGYPSLIGSTILEKRKYALENFDNFRKFLMNEPRGHNGMYGAIITEPTNAEAHVGVLFIHNSGYSTMCGHAIIALGRYAVDRDLVCRTSPETEVIFECPCGLIRAYVDCSSDRSGMVRFHSMPAFVYKLDLEVDVKNLGKVKLDIAYGGAFYALVDVSQFNMDIHETSLPTLIQAASDITETIKTEIALDHPDSPDLAFLYGTILTDGKDAHSDTPTSNICVFADKQVDRSPTGSGVIARIALMYKKNCITLNQQKEFKSIVNTHFTGKAVRETNCGSYDAVIVEVAGTAYYTGNHSFVIEDEDPLPFGFQLPC